MIPEDRVQKIKEIAAHTHKLALQQMEYEGILLDLVGPFLGNLEDCKTMESLLHPSHALYRVHSAIQDLKEPNESQSTAIVTTN